jgi:hypothetical protein
MRNILKTLVLSTGILIIAGFKFNDDFKLCNPDKIYATNDYLYKDNYFKDFEKLNDFPKYPGGLDSIQKFFDTNVSLRGDETKLVAKYHVVFIVNCNGDLGRFELKSKPFAGYDRILEGCKKMTKWIPAKKDGNSIDCYVRLGFTNQAGKLKVDYREK